MTIMESLGGHGGETIMEVLGGAKGETISEVIEETGLTPVTPEKYTVTYDANGGSGTIEPVEVTVGESITLNDGSGLTAPEGKEFLGWAKTDSAQSATVTSPFTPDKDTILYAVWGDVTPGE